MKIILVYIFYLQFFSGCNLSSPLGDEVNKSENLKPQFTFAVEFRIKVIHSLILSVDNATLMAVAYVSEGMEYFVGVVS